MSLVGHAPDRRDHVRRLPADGRRRHRQPAAQVPLHVGRPVRGAGHDPRRSAARPAASAPSTAPPARAGSCTCPGCASSRASSPGSAYSLLRAAIDDPNPVLFYEHKGLYARKGPVVRGAIAEIGKAAVLRDGQRRDDRGHAADGGARARRGGAAGRRRASTPRSSTCAGSGRWTCRRSGRRSSKTGRLVIAEEQVHAAGWGATIISELTIGGIALGEHPARGEPARRPAHPVHPAPRGRGPAVRRSASPATARASVGR